MRNGCHHGVCSGDRQRTEGQELHHLATSHVVVTLPAHGKILTPAGIFLLLALKALVLVLVCFFCHLSLPEAARRHHIHRCLSAQSARSSHGCFPRRAALARSLWCVRSLRRIATLEWQRPAAFFQCFPGW